MLRLRHIDPAVVVVGLVVAHVVVWTVVPWLSHRGLPLDVVEGYAVGREWVIGYHKHPALPWWLLEATYVATGGAVGWPAYMLSALAIALTYWTAWLIGRDLLGPTRAAAGTLLLTGIVYFSWVTPEYNHNVVQMPIWTGVILAVLRARQHAGAGWWALVGALSAAGLYAKFTMALLLVAAALYILVDPRCRAQLRTIGPWVGLATFLILLVPLARWLVATDFHVFDYAEARASNNKSSGIPTFFLKQVAATAVLYVMLVLAFGRRLLDALAPDRLAAALRQDRVAVVFLTWFHFAPLVLAMLVSAVLGGGLRGAWGTPMLSLTGLLVLAWAPALVDTAALRRLTYAAAGLMVAVPAAYAVSARTLEPAGIIPARIDWPQREIAERLERIWIERTNGAPLRIVAGDYWTAGIVSLYGSRRPTVIADADLARSPWVSEADVVRHGAIIVWWASPIHPPLHMRPLAGGISSTPERFVVPAAKGRRTNLFVHYVVRAPGAILPHVSSDPR